MSEEKNKDKKDEIPFLTTFPLSAIPDNIKYARLRMTRLTKDELKQIIQDKNITSFISVPSTREVIEKEIPNVQKAQSNKFSFRPEGGSIITFGLKSRSPQSGQEVKISSLDDLDIVKYDLEPLNEVPKEEEEVPEDEVVEYAPTIPPNSLPEDVKEAEGILVRIDTEDELRETKKKGKKVKVNGRHAPTNKYLTNTLGNDGVEVDPQGQVKSPADKTKHLLLGALRSNPAQQTGQGAPTQKQADVEISGLKDLKTYYAKMKVKKKMEKQSK